MWTHITYISFIASILTVLPTPATANDDMMAVLPDTEVGTIEFRNASYNTNRIFIRRCGRKVDDFILINKKKDIVKVKEGKQWSGDFSVGCYVFTIRRDAGWFDYSQREYKINLRPKSQGVLRIIEERSQYTPSVNIQFIASKPYFGRAY